MNPKVKVTAAFKQIGLNAPSFPFLTHPRMVVHTCKLCNYFILTCRLTKCHPQNEVTIKIFKPLSKWDQKDSEYQKSPFLVIWMCLNAHFYIWFAPKGRETLRIPSLHVQNEWVLVLLYKTLYDSLIDEVLFDILFCHTLSSLPGF